MAKKTSNATQLSKEDAESFTAGLGQITAGSYRLILLADKQGVPKALGYESVRDWVNERLGGYVRHPVEERRRIVEELSISGENSTRIAKALGVSHTTVTGDKVAGGNYQKRKYTPPASSKKQDLDSQKRDSKDAPLPKDWDKPKAPDPDQLAEKGLELLVWEKVKDRFLPFWNELLEDLEPDEAAILSYVIWQYAPTKANV